MLPGPKLQVLLELIDAASPEELAWINGYLNGVVSKQTPVSSPVISKNGVHKITIAYGTETGNSKKLATEFAAKAKKHGINAKVQSLDQYRLNDLPKEEYFLAVISTHGDGEPPAAAKKFYDHVHQNGFKLDKLKYSVLALGDTSYPLFCKTGEDVDAQLTKLGGKRIAPLQKCDIDFAEDADQWFCQVFEAFNNQGGLAASYPPTTLPAKKPAGKKTHSGTILTHINLNDRGSSKETFHIEIAAEDVNYQPGDSIGIVPENDPAMVHKILSLAAAGAQENLDYKGELISFYDLLRKKLNIVYLPERVIKHYATVVQQQIPLVRTDLAHLIEKYPVKNQSQFHEVIRILEPITPRLYSIASSPNAHAGEVHITVAKNSFHHNEEIKYGFASAFLSHLAIDNTFPFYIHPNSQFRLPEENKNIIMIGPGTGIAPFRSFIAERDAMGASGKNWLFFGEQHFISDFLYQTELQNWYETNVLTRISVAFSRDQPEKIYVQHRMKEQGAELFEWLQAGSYVYLCGTKHPMSTDVENTLLQIIEEYGERSTDDAIQYLDDMKEDGRYVKDVY